MAFEMSQEQASACCFNVFSMACNAGARLSAVAFLAARAPLSTR